MALIEETIRIDATVAPPGETVRDFGRGLFLHRVANAALNQGEAELIRTVRAFPTARALEAANPGADVVAAGRAWFSADVHPRNLLVGTQIATPQPSFIFGAPPGTAVEIEALGDNYAMNIGGNAITVDFDTEDTYAKQAMALQTAIRTVGAYSAASVTYDGQRFVVQGEPGYGFVDGFDAAAARLGLHGDGVSVVRNVSAAETPGQALTRIEGINPDFFWLGVHPDLSQDYAQLDLVRDWVAARRLQVGAIFDVYGQDVLADSEVASIGARLSAQKGDGIAAIYNGLTPGAIDQKGLRYMARFSSVNFNQPAGDINGKFLTLVGGTPNELTSQQRAELDRKRINWYVPAGTGASTGQGVSFGTWLDVYYFLSWFSQALRIAAWNHLRASAVQGGTPLTTQGLQSIAASLATVCEQAVRFGAIAPNPVSPVTRRAIQLATANDDFNGVLSTGYLIVPPRVSDLSQTVRDTRSAIPIKIFAKGSGKINNIDISLVLEN